MLTSLITDIIKNNVGVYIVVILLTAGELSISSAILLVIACKSVELKFIDVVSTPFGSSYATIVLPHELSTNTKLADIVINKSFFSLNIVDFKNYLYSDYNN